MALRSPNPAVKTAGAKYPIFLPYLSEMAPQLYDPIIIPMNTTLVIQLSCAGDKSHLHFSCTAVRQMFLVYARLSEQQERELEEVAPQGLDN